MPEGDDNKAEALQKLLDKNNGDAMRTLGILFSENFDLREKNRKLKEQLPADGMAVLKKEDADRLAAFDALGKKPDKLATIIAEHGDSSKEVNRLKRKDVLRDVAALGFGGSKLKLSVLEKLDGEVEGIEYEIKESKDGKAVTVKHGGKELPLEKFATEKWADFVPALKVDAGNTQTKRGNGHDPAPAGGTTVLERIRKQEEARKERAQPQGGSLREKWFGTKTS